MAYDPNVHHRRTIRLRGYDYAQAGVYFVTLCIQDRLMLCEPAAAHEMIESWWAKLPEKFPAVEIDACVIMPNHLHGIIALVERAERQTLGTVMQWYKTMTTNAYIRGVKEHGWPPFHERLWQRNYWEHIVRDDTDLARLRRYIEVNPARWMEDALHP